jgi:hypothetical protein
MSKVCLINQPVGLGDIFFLQKFVDIKIAEGFKVIFPVADNLIFIKDYISKPNLEFYKLSDHFEYKQHFHNSNIIKETNFEYYPIRFADQHLPGSCMEVKYLFVGYDFNGWQEHFSWTRNIQKENHLYYNILGLNDNEDYTVVSNSWGTLPNVATKPVPYNKNYKLVKVEVIDGFNPFDWVKVFENAKEISIVDTSFNYIIEKLNLRADKLLLTSRFTSPNFFHIINLFKKNWIFLQ